ncbi:saccharopine dehydrogenase C-terminal domain-containing protein [Desulfosarcina variabilis]|uniref:saccharopine dehydrogenase C-terminal domain-containing protein n=1 Tax=Desulfosarcina variabilis TaxID=2300 RepID=UPI003AFA0545
MQVMVQGQKGGRQRCYTWNLFDRSDPSTGVHSMARTTGYTATVTARLVAGRHFVQTGIIPPERIGMDPACMTFILDGLAQRGVIYEESVKEG